MKLLFEHADILTKENGELCVWKDAYLGVEDERICCLSKTAPADARDYSRRNFQNKLLIPGFVNGHCHSPMTLLRGLGSDLPLQSWLFDHMFPTEDRLRPEDIRRGSALAILEMLSCGTTSFSDMYFMCDETIEACIEAGIKANIGRPVQSFDESEPYKENTRAKESFALYRRWNGADHGRILVDFSIHAEYTCTENLARGYAEDCAKIGGRMHVHLSETKSEHEECIARRGCTPTEWLEKTGVLQIPTAAAHGVRLTDEDIALLAARGASVVHNPTSNMKLGSGFCPVQKLMDAGVNVALGTDGAASNNNLNMLEELHLASVIHNGFACDAEIMPPRTTLQMAAENGAKMQGRPDTGTLEVGKRADIAAIDLCAPHLFPNLDEPALLCYSAQSSDVCMTMVDGRILYENGGFLTVDREKILAEAKKSAAYLYE